MNHPPMPPGAPRPTPNNPNQPGPAQPSPNFTLPGTQRLDASSGNYPPARLYMLSGDQVGRTYPLTNRITTLGRGAANDIVIADSNTSRRHMQIVFENGGYWAVDTGSANGFYLNDKQVTRAQLKHDDLITIGLVRMAFQVDGVQAGLRPSSTVTMDAPPAPFAPPPGAPPPAIDETSLERIDLRNRPVTTLGRDQQANNVFLDNPQVSRQHLDISNQNGTFVVSDRRSTNGTFVNGQRVSSPTPLNDGDIINVGPYRFMFAKSFLNRSQEDDSVRIDVLNLSKQVSPTLNLLQNVSFTILPREFVAIVGVSGSGKSTLLDAISGVRPATGGTVLYNKAAYYPQMEVYRSSIGYVPQDDIVPAELTVYKALYYAARLRLPKDTTDAELNERLEDVIDDLDLELRRDTPIHLLSGGQRKRVSIAAELISEPRLFFLDEPTSGLDPGLEGRMMELMRKLADQGRTVVLITHATQNVELCDQTLFLARGGYVAYYGSPQNALEYFGVTRFSDIYNKLEQELSPDAWAVRFRESPYYSQTVASRLRAVAGEAAQYGLVLNGPPGTFNNPPNALAAPPVVFRRLQAPLSNLQQFGLLFRRYLEIMMRDNKNLLILLLQAPVIALMMVLVFNRSDFARPGGDYGSAKTLVFLMVIVAVWFGTSNSAREIVKEAPIYRRERRIGLRLIPYVFSKLAVQTLLVLVQVALLVGIVWIGIGLGNFEGIIYLYLTLVLTALGGVTMGLLISAMTTNSDRATSFVPVVLIPQIIFSGAVIALERIGVVGNAISHLMISRWAYGASGRILGLDAIDSSRVRFNGPPPDQADRIQSLFPGSIFFDQRTLDWYLIPKRDREFNLDVFLQWGILGLFMAVSLALIVTFQLRKDRQYTR